MPDVSAEALRTRLAIVRHGMQQHGHRLPDFAILDALELVAAILARLEKKAGA